MPRGSMRMDDDTSPVYARVWQMQGGDLDDPGFAETYCAEVVPRLNDLPGLVGLSVLLDRGRKALLGLSFWDSAEAREGSAVVVGRILGALLGLSSAELGGPWVYDVVHSGLRGVLAQPTQLGEADDLLVRVVTLEGGEIAEPSTVTVLTRHLSADVALLPGCVGTLLLRDADRSAVLAASFWSGARAAERAAALSEGSARSIVAATRSSSSEGTYRILVHQPIPGPVS